MIKKKYKITFYKLIGNVQEQKRSATPTRS